MISRLPALLLVGASALLASCGPSDLPMEKIPLTGEVKLEYSSRAGNALVLNLDNGASEELVLWGGREDRMVLPQGLSTACTSLSGSGDSFGASIIDGPNWELIRVPSGNRLSLSISAHDFENGRCEVQLQLENGTSIDSPQFEMHGEANADECVHEKMGGNITGSCVIAVAKAEVARRQGSQNYRRFSISYDSTTAKWGVMATVEPHSLRDSIFLLVAKNGQVLEYTRHDEQSESSCQSPDCAPAPAVGRGPPCPPHPAESGQPAASASAQRQRPDSRRVAPQSRAR